MSTPASSSRPLRRSLWAVPAFGLAFIGLAMADDWRTFAPALLGQAPPAAPRGAAQDGERAAQIVRAWNGALAEAYAARSVDPLRRAGLTGPLVDEVEAELRLVPGEAPRALERLDVLRVEPGAEPGAFEVETRELWQLPGGGKPARFRYRVSAALRVEEMVRVLPEPAR